VIPALNETSRGFPFPLLPRVARLKDGLDHALDHLQRVVARANEIDLNTGVYAYLRIGQIYDLTHRRQQALEAYKKAIAYAPEADAAQEARKYLDAPYRRS